MVYHHISEDMKTRVLWLLENGDLPDAYDVAEIFGVSERSIYRWKANLDEYGSVAPPPNPSRGRPRILNADQTHDLMILLQEAPELYLDELNYYEKPCKKGQWVGLRHKSWNDKSWNHEDEEGSRRTCVGLRSGASQIETPGNRFPFWTTIYS